MIWPSSQHGYLKSPPSGTTQASLRQKGLVQRCMVLSNISVRSLLVTPLREKPAPTLRKRLVHMQMPPGLHQAHPLQPLPRPNHPSLPRNPLESSFVSQQTTRPGPPVLTPLWLSCDNFQTFRSPQELRRCNVSLQAWRSTPWALRRLRRSSPANPLLKAPSREPQQKLNRNGRPMPSLMSLGTTEPILESCPPLMEIQSRRNSHTRLACSHIGSMPRARTQTPTPSL